MNRSGQVFLVSSRLPLFPDLAEAWHHRGLLWMFIRRNIKARYMQTVLGSAWIVIQPLILAGLLTIIVGMLLHAPSDGLPYALFALSGSSIWNTFQRATNDTSISFASSGNIILKVYFPRILIPLSAALTVLVEFVPILAVLLIATFAYGRFPGLPILMMPFFLLLACLLAFAIGLWITMLDAIYRDLRLIVPSLLQMLLFLSPVMYASTAIPAKWLWLYELNPMVAILQGFRWSLISGVAPPALLDLLWALGLSCVILVSGLHSFAKLEQFAVDRI
jgi:lipopolysaccharide transport system permease protein